MKIAGFHWLHTAGIPWRLAVRLRFAAGADLFAVLGMEFTAPRIGMLLTGIFASRGSHYV